MRRYRGGLASLQPPREVEIEALQQELAEGRVLRLAVALLPRVRFLVGRGRDEAPGEDGELAPVERRDLSEMRDLVQTVAREPLIVERHVRRLHYDVRLEASFILDAIALLPRLRTILGCFQRLRHKPEFFEVGRAVALGEVGEMKAIGPAVTDKLVKLRQCLGAIHSFRAFERRDHHHLVLVQDRI